MDEVLVIGGSGFVGSHTADALSEKGHIVTIFDKKESKLFLSGPCPTIKHFISFLKIRSSRTISINISNLFSFLKKPTKIMSNSFLTIGDGE